MLITTDKALVGPAMAQSAPKASEAPPVDLDRLQRLRVPAIVKLAGKKMTVEAIANITVGTIIEFDKAADSELELLIRRKTVGYGVAVKVGENFGLRVTSMCDVRHTISSLGTT